MKGQVSVEFISLLILTLVASAVLISGLTDKRVSLSETRSIDRAELLAQRVAYTLEYTKARENSTNRLRLPPEISGEPYTLEVDKNGVVVGNISRPVRFYTLVDRELELKPGRVYTVEYNGTLYVY